MMLEAITLTPNPWEAVKWEFCVVHGVPESREHRATRLVFANSQQPIANGLSRGSL